MDEAFSSPKAMVEFLNLGAEPDIAAAAMIDSSKSGDRSRLKRGKAGHR